MIELNVGLVTADGEFVVCPEHAVKVLRKAGYSFAGAKVVVTADEPVLVTTGWISDTQSLYSASEALNQNCIAARHSDGAGELVGPNTTPYGGRFNDDYFVRF